MKAEDLLDGLHDALLVLDCHWRYVYLNRAAAEMLRVERTRAMGRPVWEDLPAGLEQTIASPGRSVDEHRPVEIETGDPTRQRRLRFRFVPFPDGILLHVVDVTGRQGTGRAEVGGEGADVLLAMVGHELRNALVSIKNGVELLRAQSSAPELRPSLDLLARQTGHLSRIIDDLLEPSLMLSGSARLSRTTLSVRDVLESASAAVSKVLNERAQHMEVELPAGADLTIQADPVRLEQVLVNLLLNAAKYSSAGSRIELAAGSEGNELVIRVTDEGIGIAAEDLPRVFELFYRSSAGRSVGQGFGVGLGIARRLVELHGGTLVAHSAGTGKGSQFTIRLPLGGEGA